MSIFLTATFGLIFVLFPITVTAQTVPATSAPATSGVVALGTVRTTPAGIELVWIPPGEFMMGSSEAEVDEALAECRKREPDCLRVRFEDETPQRRVSIREGFFIGKYEVTVGQWRAVMGSVRFNTLECGRDCPVEGVSWRSIQELLEKLNALDTFYEYRLPTEAEWEYAARAGTTTAYSFGKDIKTNQANFRSDQQYSDEEWPEAAKVGSYGPNAWGLHDMHGNVSEWVRDIYTSNHINLPVDGSAVESSQDEYLLKFRVLRGGSYQSGPFDVRSASRTRWPDDSGVIGNGLRLAARLRKESEVWPGIERSDGIDDFRQYLGMFPEGRNAGAARKRLEELVWNSVKATHDRGKIEAYLAEFPDGANAAAAKTRLRDLPTAGTVRRNPIGMELVWVPFGEFVMGSENGKSDEQPVRKVTIGDGFWIGRFEVTQRQWETVMGSNPSYFKKCGGNCPVENVSWIDARDFIARLNARNDGFVYSLPSEAQWEYAARAGTTDDRYGDLDDIAWYVNNSGNIDIDADAISDVTRLMDNGGRTRPVGGKQPNAFGLFDMLGNVGEWVEDFYSPDYRGLAADGGANLTVGDGAFRVQRGASWASNGSRVRSAYREQYRASDRSRLLGFRVLARLR